jgi:hypothetical protein
LSRCGASWIAERDNVVACPAFDELQVRIDSNIGRLVVDDKLDRCVPDVIRRFSSAMISFAINDDVLGSPANRPTSVAALAFKANVRLIGGDLPPLHLCDLSGL